MDDREQQRKIRHRLAVLRHAEEVTGNVAATCRYYGISRQCFYKWRNRYEEFGEEGLRDGSSKPLRSPNATSTEIVGKIIYLRQNYHFGPQKISMYLARYHEVTVSPSSVWRILKRLDLNRLPASQRYKRHERRWKRYEKQLPGHRVLSGTCTGPIFTDPRSDGRNHLLAVQWFRQRLARRQGFPPGSHKVSL
jgi:transposase